MPKPIIQPENLTEIFTKLKQSLYSSSKARAYAESRNIYSAKLEAGYNNGTHYSKLKNCIIFPLKDKENNIVSFYGRNIESKSKDDRHFYTTGRKGLYPNYPNQETETLILTESIWAGQMKELLVKANNYKNLGIIDETLIESIENQYCKILRNGLAEQPKEILLEKIKRGRKAKSKSVRLLDVFINRGHQILMFIYNNNVPFDNNLAERDLRMVKLKQKISGCFRSENGAKVFWRIRSYVSTVRKQGLLVLDSIQLAINNAPVNISLG